MKSNYSKIENLRHLLQNMDRSFTKCAYLGGDANDQSFEQSFSDIAHFYIQDKAPSLIDAEQGFQVIERSEDSTKAVGVLGFNVNGIQLFAPVFFLNGKIKGHELLYISDIDTFVPLKEAWLNEISRRKPITIGDPVARQSKGLLAPDLQVLSIPPSKTASFKQWPTTMPPEILDMALTKFCKMAGKDIVKTAEACRQLRKDIANYTKFASYMPLAGKKCANGFVSFLDQYPLVKKAFVIRNNEVMAGLEKSAALFDMPSILDDLMAPDFDFNEFLKNHGLLGPLKKKPGGVKVISMSFSMSRGLPLGITDSSKEKMLRDGYIVQDDRDEDEVSQIVSNNDDYSTTTNPIQSGIYDVLLAPHKVRKCAIVYLKSKDFDSEQFPRVIMTDLDNNHTWEGLATEVWVKRAYPRNDYTKWLNKQKPIVSVLSGNSKDEDFLLLNELGGSWGPYKVNDKLGTDTYQVQACCKPMRMEIIHHKGASVALDEENMCVPATTKAIVLHDPVMDRNSGFQPYDYKTARNEIFCPITPKAFKEACYKGAEVVKLLVRDGECSINNQPVTPAFTGFKTLIEDYGLRENTARDFMKKAEASTYHTLKFFIKRGAKDPARIKDESLTPPIPTIVDSSSNPLGFMGALAPNGEALSSIIEDDHREDYAYHPDSAYPAEDAKNIERAIQSGQKEVFDVSMLKQLLTNADTETQVDKLLTRLTKGMNSVGKLLFLYYWKGDQFEENYGPQKLPELEGSLKKAFEVLGDIILFLKRNKINNLDFEGSEPINLSDNEE